MLSNRLALLEYDVPGPLVIHERMILDHIGADEYVVCTPDRDIFVEQLSVDNSDLRSFRLRPGPHQLPPGVALGNVYGLPAWTAAEVASIRDEAARLAATERAARGAGAGAVVAVPAGGAVAVAAPAVPAPPPDNKPPGAADLVGGVLYWVAAECIDGYRYGQVVDSVADAKTLGAKTVHRLADVLHVH